MLYKALLDKYILMHIYVEVDGNWGQWGTWSGCDVTCGDGHMTRTRTCSSPAPEHGGKNCHGDNHESNTCMQTTKCPGLF